ncbi:MAG: hypothetical protein NTV34_09185, partial [Proteobacteria bacterium]|nr:hypothetical protein [Pseudomonadota bacterium]
VIETIQRGLSFKWSLTGNKSAPTAAETPQIRYGLVVSEILPQEAPGIASSGTISESYWQYARQARVVYTIDRLEEDTSKRRVFPTALDDQGPAPAAVKSRHIFVKPSTEVSFKVEAANSEDTVSDKVGGGSLPGAKISAAQADGLVSAQIITNSRLGKESMSFETMLPLIGAASITKKWNNSFAPTQTSANNLLIKPSAPKLNVHHFILEDRFKGELLVKASSIDFGLAIEPRKGWAPEDHLGRSGDKISMTFTNTF